MPVVIDRDNLPSPVGIGLTDLPNIGGASGPPGLPCSGNTDIDNAQNLFVCFGWDYEFVPLDF